MQLCNCPAFSLINLKLWTFFKIFRLDKNNKWGWPIFLFSSAILLGVRGGAITKGCIQQMVTKKIREYSISLRFPLVAQESRGSRLVRAAAAAASWATAVQLSSRYPLQWQCTVGPNDSCWF